MAKKKTLGEHKALTLRERCHLLHGNGSWKLHGCKRLGIQGIEMHDGPLGLRIPDEEGFQATLYPAPALLACSFDEELEKEIGQAMGEECQSHGVSLLLAPGVNVKRNPLCGRNFEYFSEDPLLAGKMGASFIQGLQSQGVGACLKHFACNNQESYRRINDSIIDERALNEIYLRPFEIAVKESDPWAIMSAYNLVNGIHCSDNEFLLVHTLREQWNYDGVVLSDWGGTFDPIYSHKHGLDVEMPGLAPCRTAELLRATKSGRLPLQAMTSSADRVLALLQKAKEGAHPCEFDPNRGHELAVKAARESMVLLKNEDGILPLSKTLMGACVIGAFAETPRVSGGGSSKVSPRQVVSFLDAIHHELPYAKGYSLNKNEDGGTLLFNAVDLASRSKTVLYFMGLPEEEESEGFDRKHLNLPENQLALFDALWQANPNIVVILSCGAPVVLPFADRAKAILLSYLGGEGVGEALRDLLSGEASPCGKLAETWPLHDSDVPSFGFYPGFQGQSVYKESIYVGYRYYLTSGVKTAFPFGHGLSYNRFSYSLSLSNSTLPKEGEVRVLVSINNRSSRPGKAVIELYAEPPSGNAFHPKRVLVAFKKVALEGNQTKTVELLLHTEDFAFYDPDSHSFQTEGGTYILALGSSCQEILDSVDLSVEGTKSFRNIREDCPVYYAVPHGGFTLYDDEFETLLGRPLPLEKDRRERPFDMDSTMEDVSWTHVGKKMAKAFDKAHPDFTGSVHRGEFDEIPLRSMLGSLGAKKARCVLDKANGHYLLSFFRRFLPYSGKDAYSDQKEEK